MKEKLDGKKKRAGSGYKREAKGTDFGVEGDGRWRVR